ncbi:MAG TPA: thioredoxin family protein [Planctomycetota bacterium]
MTKHKIQILGTGCAKCVQLTNATKAAADHLGLAYDLEKVTDFLKFADFGVMVTPALVVDGKVLMAGKVPSATELERLLPKA